MPVTCISFGSLPDLFEDPSPYVPFTLKGPVNPLDTSCLDAIKLIEKLTGETDHAEILRMIEKLPHEWTFEATRAGCKVREVTLYRAQSVIKNVDHSVTQKFRREFLGILQSVREGEQRFLAKVEVDFVDINEMRRESAGAHAAPGGVADEHFDVVELAGSAVRVVRSGDNKGLIDAKSLVTAMTGLDGAKGRQVRLDF
jgi:hypothetical protein